MAFFTNYLNNRTYIVKTPNDASKAYNISTGVPQGSILGPLLFTIYMNDLPEAVKFSEITMYADDTTIVLGSKIPVNIQVKMAHDLKNMESWFKANKLSLNADKTDYVLIANCHRRERFEQIKITVGGKLLEAKEHTKILGVTIQNDLA